MTDNIKLSENNDVYQRGDTVIRPYDEYTTSIHSLLQHFYDNGLPVPKPINLNDNGFEVQTLLGGVPVHPYKWSDSALVDIAKLTAKIHSVSKTFIPADNAKWRPWCLREIGNDTVYSHGDIAPWNILTDCERPTGIVDFEYAGPIDPITELARICWLFPQLHDDDLGELYNLPSPQKRAEQIRLIVDTYGLTEHQRNTFYERILEVVICETAHEAIDPQLNFDSTGSLWGFAWRTRSLYWIWRHGDIIRKALS